MLIIVSWVSYLLNLNSTIMSIQVSFRIVGLYCYAENVLLPNSSPSDTVESIMTALKEQIPYDFVSGALPNGKVIVDTLSFTYPDNLTPPLKEPFNSKNATEGFRDLSNNIGPTSLVWQYYRSVTGKIDGEVVEIKLLQRHQPSFTEQSLDFNDPFFGNIPASFEPSTYNLTWRLVQIQMSPESQAKFIAAKAEALKKRVG